MDEGTWHRSSTCEGGFCVEAVRINGEVRMRDSDSHELAVNEQAWTEFVEGVKRGEFDRPQ